MAERRRQGGDGSQGDALATPIRFYQAAFRRYLAAAKEICPVGPDAVFPLPPADEEDAPVLRLAWKDEHGKYRMTKHIRQHVPADQLTDGRRGVALRACGGFARLAVKAADDGNLQAAWARAAMSVYWLGVMCADDTATRDPASRKAIMRDLARFAAQARHAPTRDARELVLAWWNKNGKGRLTKEDAADAIVKLKLVNEARSTIRKWLRGA